MPQPLAPLLFNCGCTAEFLEDHLGSEQADILLRLWTYGENGGGQHNEMLDLYTRYGSEKISDAVMNFHRHRDLSARYCRRATGPRSRIRARDPTFVRCVRRGAWSLDFVAVKVQTEPTSKRQRKTFGLSIPKLH